MNKLRSISLKSLVDEGLYENFKEKRGKISNSFRSFFHTNTNFNKIEKFNEKDEETDSKKQFRSFVTKSFWECESDQNKDECLEDMFNKFMEEEIIYRKKMAILLDNLSNLDLNNSFDLEVALTNLLYNISEKFIPDLQNSLSHMEEIVDCFDKNNNLFSIYKNVIMDAHDIQIELSNDSNFRKDFDTDDLSLPKNRLIDYLIFLHKLVKYCINNKELNSKILKVIQLISHIVNIENEIKIRKIVSEIIMYQTLHIERCSKFIIEVMPVLESNIRYKNKSHRIAGKIPEIYQAEKLLYEEIKKSPNTAETLIECYLQHANLFDLYVEDAKKDRTIKTAFCKDSKISEKMFQIVLDHLFNIKNLLSALLERFAKSNIDSTVINKLLNIIHETLQTIDYVMAVGQIFGENIDLENQGKILLRSKFKVKYEKEPQYESTVFLFEKSIVFTKEEKLTSTLSGYIYKSSVPLNKLGIDDLDKINNFKVYFQEKHDKSQTHILISIDGRHGDIKIWRNKLTEMLMEQLRKTKEEHQQSENI